MPIIGLHALRNTVRYTRIALHKGHFPTSFYWSPTASPVTRHCEFPLHYEEEDEETGKKKSKKKKPWRLRWPDDFHDEVLARLLELNEQRHKEELLAGKQLGKTAKPTKPKRAGKKQADADQSGLF